jgi:hypothetical protein
MITQQQVDQAIALQSSGNAITASDVEQLLANAHGTTFAQIVQVTPVPLARAHQGTPIFKMTVANVQLFNNLKAFSDVYTAAVKRTAEKLGVSDPRKVEDFEKSDNYFEHTSCYSVVAHKLHPEKKYLFAIYNNAESVYLYGGAIVQKSAIVPFLTPSEAKRLLNPNNEVHNVTNDVTHTVQVRTVSLQNIVSVRAMGQQLSV